MYLPGHSEARFGTGHVECDYCVPSRVTASSSRRSAPTCILQSYLQLLRIYFSPFLGIDMLLTESESKIPKTFCALPFLSI